MSPKSAPDPLFSLKNAQAAVAGLAGLAGLGVYVYLLGGVVAWLRVTAARLPTGSVTPAFESRALVSSGMTVLVVEAGLLVAVCAVILVVYEIVRRAERFARRAETGSGRRFVRPLDDDDDDRLFALTIVFRALLIGVLLAALGSATGALTEAAWIGLTFVFATLIAAAELGLRWRTTVLVPIAARPPSGRRFLAESLARAARWLLIAETVVLGVWKLAAPLGTTVLVLLGLLVLTHYARRLRRLTPRPHLYGAATVVVVMTALNLIIVPYLATPPVDYERAMVTTPSGDTMQGAYLGRSSDGLFLATCEPVREGASVSRLARVEVIADEDVDELTFGGPKYSFDVGHRPTLFALSEYFLTGENVGGKGDGVQLDLRHARKVCVREGNH